MSKKINNPRFNVMRHIETVRNYLGMSAKELIDRASRHDQSKFDPVEMDLIEKYQPLMYEIPYDSPKYHKLMKNMDAAAVNHFKNNSHHPEYYTDKINGMTLFDVLEMICDWKAASLRTTGDNLEKSIKVNAKKHKISPQLTKILQNTAIFINKQDVYNKGHES